MIKYVVRKSDLEADKYHDPKNPWLILIEDGGKITARGPVDKFPSHRAANREIRKLVSERRERT